MGAFILPPRILALGQNPERAKTLVFYVTDYSTRIKNSQYRRKNAVIPQQR